MSKITGLLPHPDKKRYTDIYVDGELLLTVSDDAVIEAQLRTGAEFDEDKLYEIERAVSLTRAKNKAYLCLSYGDMSAKRLHEKLTHAGFDADIADECVAAMKQSGLIDDERYAVFFAKHLACTKLYGPRRIRDELRAHGVSAEITEDVVSTLDVDFDENIRKLVQGKFKSKTDKRALCAALIRYGYDYDSVRKYEDDYE